MDIWSVTAAKVFPYSCLANVKYINTVNTASIGRVSSLENQLNLLHATEIAKSIKDFKLIVDTYFKVVWITEEYEWSIWKHKHFF